MMPKLVRLVFTVACIFASLVSTCATFAVDQALQPAKALDEQIKGDVQLIELGIYNDDLLIEYRFRCRGGASELQDPFWERGSQLPGRLFIYTDSGFIGSLVPKPYVELPNSVGKFQGAGTAFLVQADIVVGRIIRIPLRSVTQKTSDVRSEPLNVEALGPGTYHIQLALLGNYLPSGSEAKSIAYSNPLAISVPEDYRRVGFMKQKKSRTSLTVERLPGGKQIEVCICFRNSSYEDQKVYNPCHDPQYVHLGILLEELDEHGGVKKTHLGRSDRSGFIFEENQWMKIPPGGIVGRLFRIETSHLDTPSCRLRASHTEAFYAESPFALKFENPRAQWFREYKMPARATISDVVILNHMDQ